MSQWVPSEMSAFKKKITSRVLIFVAKERSAAERYGLSFGLTILSFLLLRATYLTKTTLYTAVILVLMEFISIISDLWFSITMGVLLTIATDYFFIPPRGRIFSSEIAVEHFVIVICATVVTSVTITSLRNALRQMYKAEKEAETARKEAEKNSEFKSKFLANMSHEIRTPINGIVGMTDLLASTPLTARQNHFVDAVRRSSNQLLSLIDDVLDLSKVEAGRLQLESMPFDLVDLADEVVATFRLLAERRGLELDSHIDAFPGSLFLGDRHRIRQVLTNLIGNALKFTPAGKVSFRVAAEAADANRRSRILFSVTDTGIGMTPETQKNLFRYFEQGNASTSRKYGGSGLGLAISKQLIDLMGGTIDVESIYGKGTTFYVVLNLPVTSKIEFDRQVSSIRQFAGHAREMLSKSERARHHILVAEDNDINQEITRSLLEDEGYQVDVASDGYEVLAAVNRRKEGYSLILMDCQMPGMDGYETAQQLRENGSDVPIIALTAHALAEDRERCLQAGMSDYIAKPFKIDTIMERVDHWVALSNRAETEKELASSAGAHVDQDIWDRLDELDSGGRKGLAGRLIALYLKSSPVGFEDLKNAVQKGDHSLLRSSAHKFKSSSGNLGLMRVWDILESLEDAHTPDSQHAALLQKLSVELKTATQALQSYQEKHQIQAPPAQVSQQAEV